MSDKEAWWLIPSSAVLLFLLINEGGFEVLKHPVLLGVFLFIAITVIFGFLKLFTYSSSDEKFKNKRTSSQIINNTKTKGNYKITKRACSELLNSKGYELNRNFNLVYFVYPIGNYDNDALIKSKNLKEIYDFAIQVEDLNILIDDRNEQKKDCHLKGLEIAEGYEIFSKTDLIKITSLDYVDFGEWADTPISKLPQFFLIKREKNSDFIVVIFVSDSIVEINNYTNQ